MLDGIAKSDSEDLREDRYGIVVALSQLSQSVKEAEDGTFTVAAETAAALLHVPKVAVFIKNGGDTLSLGGTVGLDDNINIASAAVEIAQAALVTSSPIVYADTTQEPSDTARKLVKSKITSIVCVPMRVSDNNVGAVVAMSDRARSFSPVDIELLHVVASEAALAVWKADTPKTATIRDPEDLIKLAQRKIKELSLVNQVSEAVNSTLDLEKLLDIALEQSMAAVEADAGSLMLISEETHRLEIAASRGIARKWVDKTSQSVGTSIAGWVAEHGESVLVTDAREDSRFQMSQFRDDITSAASVPLKSKGEVIGVLNVNTTRTDRFFDERDLELLATVANQMAVAIENARLYARVNRRTKQLDSLLGISKTVTSTLNLDEVMRRLTEEICRLFQLDVCALLLVDELSGRMRLGYGSGLKTRRKYAYYDLAAPLAVKVKTTGKKLVVRDLDASRTLWTEMSKQEGVHSAIAIPLKNQGKLMGVAVGFSKSVRRFAKSQLGITRQLGELAGVAIHNARVYRNTYKIADILQQRLVPASIPEIDGLDIGYKFLPAREVGGDYYDFITVGPGRVGVIVGDVAGSDVEAAEYTTMGKHVLRSYARICPTPSEALVRTNDLICEDTRAEMFISLFYGIIDLSAGQLAYANAGCEPAVYYCARNNKSSLLFSDGILLGIKPGSTFEERNVNLGPGDVLVLYTDGLTEAGVNREMFGRQRVMDTVEANAHLSAQQIADALHDALLDFVHGRVTDDVAMVVLKVGDA